MRIKDLVLSREICQRLKAAGFEFLDSVFVWANPDSTEWYVDFRNNDYEGWQDQIFTLTLHEAYVWILKLVMSNKIDAGASELIFHEASSLDNQRWPERITFTDGVTVGISPELSPMLAVERYINKLLDHGKLIKGGE